MTEPEKETRLRELEESLANVKVSDTFTQETHGLTSPAGDVAVPFLDKTFSQLEEYLDLKLADGVVKTVVLSQLRYLYLFMRSSVQHALT